MMMEKPRIRILAEQATKAVTSSSLATKEHEKIRQDQFYHVLQKIRENDIHFGEHEMTLSLWTDPRDRRTPSSCRLPPSPRIEPISVKTLSEQDLIEKLRDQTEKLFELVCTTYYRPCTETKICTDHLQVRRLIFDKLIYLDDPSEFVKRMAKIQQRGHLRGGVIFRGNLKQILTDDILDLVIQPRIEQKQRKKQQELQHQLQQQLDLKEEQRKKQELQKQRNNFLKFFLCCT